MEIDEVFVTPPTLMAQAAPPADPPPPAVLPATASLLPSVALSGLAIAGLGLMLRFITKRIA